MRFTIERLRALVLAAGVLLIAAVVVFLAIGQWRHRLTRHDLPKRLGIDIQQEANGFTYTQAHRGHTLFKIQASKVVELKQGNALLHKVRIELYGADGSRTDRIEGDDFEYDQQAGTARANGPVEITIRRPGATAGAEKSATGGPGDEIHVKTSGLVFNQESGLANTSEPVEFVLAQGKGSAQGATFDSQQGLLVLDKAVKLDLQRGGEWLRLDASHAEFERDRQAVRLTSSVAHARGDELDCAQATLQFRDDGSASQLDATDGFVVTSATGSRLTAPTGRLQFDEENRPQTALLQGGVTVDAATAQQKLHGEAPTMRLGFTQQGVLRTAHLERGVKLVRDAESGTGIKAATSRDEWNSAVADLNFRDVGRGQLELATVNGTGGVVVRDETRRGQGAPTPFRMSADTMTGQFGAGSALTEMTGSGHAEIDQTTATGTRQSTRGDRLVAQFAAGENGGHSQRIEPAAGSLGASRVQSATVEGHVVLTQQPPAGARGSGAAGLRAMADEAVYGGDGGRLRLTGTPRVESDGLQLTARTIDVAQATGEALARGDVKATWMGDAKNLGSGGAGNGQAVEAAQLGGQGPAHAIAAEAHLSQSTGEVELRGGARLWQQGNSISAPLIVLNRTNQTLVARTTATTEPVEVVMVSAAGSLAAAPGKTPEPSVIRMRGGDLKYSAAERKAVLRGGVLGRVVAESGDMTSSSREVDLILLPPGNHAGKDGAPAQVDRMRALGQVELTAQGRIGSGEELNYSSDTGRYVLTGTSTRPPRLVDPVRGSVTGEVLIFNTRDDSVKVESMGEQTTTETIAPATPTKRRTGPR